MYIDRFRTLKTIYKIIKKVNIMKIYIKIISTIGVLLLLMSYSIPSTAQEIKKNTVVTDSVYVHGVCGQCKDRIENAALIKGVKKVTWDKKNQYLTVIYKPSKVSLEDIQKEVAKAGHDTGEFIADDVVYNALPGCCLYRSGEIAPH